jgi:small subunit ribosomal protein S16
MVKIRLRRTGAKKQPQYRVVVTDSRSPRDGRFIETIGYYNPRTEPPTVEVNAERALYWLSVGAQPSEAVGRMLDKMGIMSRVEAVRRGDVSIEEILKELELAEAKAKEIAEEAAIGKAEEEEAVEEEETVEEAALEEAADEEVAEEEETVEEAADEEVAEEEEAVEEAVLEEAEEEEVVEEAGEEAEEEVEAEPEEEEETD